MPDLSDPGAPPQGPFGNLPPGLSAAVTGAVGSIVISLYNESAGTYNVEVSVLGASLTIPLYAPPNSLPGYELPTTCSWPLPPGVYTVFVEIPDSQYCEKFLDVEVTNARSGARGGAVPSAGHSAVADQHFPPGG